jgi:hypothetical protein
MSAPPTDAPARETTLEWEDAVPPAPPESTFWQRYNQHLEFPTSVLISFLMLSLCILIIVVGVWLGMLGHPDRSQVGITLGIGGPDDTGDGSPGTGGVQDPLAIGLRSPTDQDYKDLNLPRDQIPEVKKDIAQVIQLDDPSQDIAIPDEKVPALAMLDKTLRDKLLGIGQKRGSGPGPGTGDDGPGAGPGGTGADSTRARSIRWILRFRTTGGRDYLDQLMAMHAVVLVPVQGSNKQMYIFRDLSNPKPGTIATDADIAQLSRLIQFSDIRQASVQGVGEALGLGYTPPVFWAFFPSELEAELARLEKAYRNRRPEDIEETVFQVTVRSGQYVLVVTEQRAKR